VDGFAGAAEQHAILVARASNPGIRDRAVVDAIAFPNSP
jgi:hypothetical protein